VSAAHTPGPWRYWPTTSGGRVAGRPADATNNFVCDVLIPERSVNWEVNARLIASAPDLLAALRLYVCAGFGNSTDPFMQRAAFDLARVVIAKATREIS